MSLKDVTADFMTELLRLCINDRDFLHITKGLLSIEHIPDERYKHLYTYLVRYDDTNSCLPTPTELSMKYRLDTEMTSIIEELKRPSLYGKERTVKEFESYIKQLKFIEFTNNCIDKFNGGYYDDAYSYAESYANIMSVINLAAGSETSLFADFAKRQDERKNAVAQSRIPFGIDGLDAVTGGMETGEYHLFLGDSGVGKSQLLIGCGLAATRAGFKVAHFSAEGTRKQNLDRFDAAWTETNYFNVKVGNIDDDEANRFLQVIRQIGAGEVFIECYEQFGSATLMNVRNKVAHYCRLYPDLKLVVLDYLELFDPPNANKNKDERGRQTQVSRFLKNLAVEFNVVVITATQSNSVHSNDKNSPDFVLTRYNLSEDKGKVRPCDGFYTINQTAEEYKQAIIRLYVDKLREGKSGQTINIVTNYKKSIFYDRYETLRTFPQDTYESNYVVAPSSVIKPKQATVAALSKPPDIKYESPSNYDDIPF